MVKLNDYRLQAGRFGGGWKPAKVAVLRHYVSRNDILDLTWHLNFELCHFLLSPRLVSVVVLVFNANAG
jgi:hypothetical protein